MKKEIKPAIPKTPVEEKPKEQQRLVVIQVSRDKIAIARDDTASSFELIGVLQAIISQIMQSGSPK